MLAVVRARSVLLVASALVLVAACAATDPGVTATRSRQASGGPLLPPTTDPDNPPVTTVPIEVEAGIVDFGSNKPEQPYDGFITAAIKDIADFWAQEMPAVYGFDFRPLDGGIFAAYPERTEPIPGCGVAETTFSDVEGNAFYCLLGDFMVYDDHTLLPALVEELGQAAVAVVMAHEFGHAIQERIDAFGEPVILKEQQADCFAGAWSARAARGESDVIFFDDNDVRGGLIAMIKVADPVELGGAGDPDAHGTGFDRVGAFQDGFTGGAAACEPFFREGRNLVDIPFDFSDPNQGNLPFQSADGADIVTLIPADLDRYWAEQLAGSDFTFVPPTLVLYATAGPFPSCPGVSDDQFARNGFFCAATNEVMLDADFATELSLNPLLGDMSVGYIISQAYSEAVQTAIATALTGEDRVLLSDCLTGTWVRDIVPPIPDDRENALLLSAGDLDEAVVIAIVRSDDTADTNVRGSAFEKIDAFRSGVLGGIDACAERLG